MRDSVAVFTERYQDIWYLHLPVLAFYIFPGLIPVIVLWWLGVYK